ncbi:uncharacterized protein LOC130786399 [Actinidia eriantha]|uniref:uncharacterized protein LOC130786399 n=1 Tax=Actinidia eriantha TaxID=165200 RepID=UPI002587C1D6|nr:uncharacterized protein LOC130786399 [Actinidia eriantha]
MEYAMHIGFEATTNETKYEALLAGLRIATELEVESLDAYSGSQIKCKAIRHDGFKLFCSDHSISNHFSSSSHHQMNGQVEVTNMKILRNLKAKLEKSKSKWEDDLPSVLWVYHTTSRIPTGETPYSLVYRTESVILVEIGVPNFKTMNFDKKTNEAELRLNLDLLTKRREQAGVPISIKSPNIITKGSNASRFYLATWS